MNFKTAFLLLLSLNACVTTQQSENLSMPAAFIGEWTEIANHAKGFKIFITADGHFDYRDSKNRPENKQYESYGTYKVVHVANDKDVYFMLHMVTPGLDAEDYTYERLHFVTYTDDPYSYAPYTQLIENDCKPRPTQEMWNTYSNDQHWKALMDARTKDAPNPDYNEKVPCEFSGSMTRYSIKH